MLDPRIDDLFAENAKLKKAVERLAAILDGVAWRAASQEEKAGIDIQGEIREILEPKQSEVTT